MAHSESCAFAGGSLFPALIPTIASDGTVVDINAHFGGCLAGMVLAFVMLITWNDEEESPPARRFAAVAAGLLPTPSDLIPLISR